MKNILIPLMILLSNYSISQTNNYSAQFDGTDDWVRIPSSSTTANIQNITLMCYAKSDALASNEDYLMGSRTSVSVREWGFRVNGNGNPNHLWAEFTIGGTYYTIAADYNTYTVGSNQYYHFAVTFDGNQVKLYQDGVEVGSQFITGSLDNNTNDIYIGYNGNGGQSYWDGLIDECSIWNRALTQSEIQNFMSCPPNGSENGLISYLNFEEGTGILAMDQSPNNNHAGLENGSLWSSDVITYNCCSQNPFTTQPTNQSVNIGNNATFTFTDNTSSSTYQWQMDNGTGFTNLSNAAQFSGTDSQSLTISTTTMSNNNTLYRCILTENGNCMDTTEVVMLTVIDNTSIFEYGNHLFNVYPNPTCADITIDVSKIDANKIELVDIAGRIVYSENINSTLATIHLNKICKKGSYFIRVIGDNGRVLGIEKVIYK